MEEFMHRDPYGYDFEHTWLKNGKIYTVKGYGCRCYKQYSHLFSEDQLSKNFVQWINIGKITTPFIILGYSKFEDCLKILLKDKILYIPNAHDITQFIQIK